MRALPKTYANRSGQTGAGGRDGNETLLVLRAGAQELRVSYTAGAWTCNCPSGQVPLPERLAVFMNEHGFNEAMS